VLALALALAQMETPVQRQVGAQLTRFDQHLLEVDWNELG
jgi:hypothetical protein